MRTSAPGPSPSLLAGVSRRDRAALRAPGEPGPIEKPSAAIREREAASLPAKANANGDRSLTRVLGLKLGRVVMNNTQKRQPSFRERFSTEIIIYDD